MFFLWLRRADDPPVLDAAALSAEGLMSEADCQRVRTPQLTHAGAGREFFDHYVAQKRASEARETKRQKVAAGTQPSASVESIRRTK